MFFLELFFVAIVDANIPLVLCNTICGQKYSWISVGKHDLCGACCCWQCNAASGLLLILINDIVSKQYLRVVSHWEVCCGSFWAFLAPSLAKLNVIWDNIKLNSLN